MEWLRNYAPARRDLITAALFGVLYLALTRFLLTHGWSPTGFHLYELAAGCTAAVLVTRNRYPQTTLLATAVIYPAYYGTGLITELHIAPILLAAYAVANSGQVRAIVVTVVAEIGVTDLYIPPKEWWGAILHPSTVPERIWTWDLSRLGLAQAATISVILLGRAAYKQRRATAQLLARHREIERLRRIETNQVVTAERTRIARELHDVVAHHISAVVIRAQAADRVAADRPDETREAVRWIAASGQETLAAMRQVVRVLRSAENGVALTPQATLAEVPAMAQRLREVGLDVSVTMPAVTPVLPAAVELAAVRIVQEALTNVLVHAQATRAIVDVRLGAEGVLIDVHDNGTAGAPPTQPIDVISARTARSAPVAASRIVSGQPLDGNGLGGNSLGGNGLVGNSLVGNSLGGNGLVGNGLVGNSLGGNGLGGNSLGGNGLVGMRERAMSCGGRLSIGTSVLGGWQISAMLRATLDPSLVAPARAS